MISDYPEFVRKSKLAEFLTEPASVRVYREYYQEINASSDTWPDPVEFFNVLLENYHLLRSYKLLPLDYRDHLLSLPLDYMQKSGLMASIIIMLDHAIENPMYTLEEKDTLIAYKEMVDDGWMINYDAETKETFHDLKSKGMLKWNGSGYSPLKEGEVPSKQININEEVLNHFIEGARRYFSKDQHTDLEKALKGEAISGRLHFLGKQKYWIEVFRRLGYNYLIIENPTSITDWLCKHFTFSHKDKGEVVIKPFNKDTVWDALTKESKSLSESKSIMKFDWLPHKEHEVIQREKEDHRSLK